MGIIRHLIIITLALSSGTLLTANAQGFPFGPATPLNPHTSTCAGSEDSCSTIGEPSWCCPDTERCAFDDDGDVACCPYGDSCRGVINYAAEPESAPSSTPALVVAARTTVSDVLGTGYPGGSGGSGGGGGGGGGGSGGGGSNGEPIVWQPIITNNNSNYIGPYDKSGGSKDRSLGGWCAWAGIFIVLFCVLDD